MELDQTSPYYRAFLLDTQGHVFAVMLLNTRCDMSSIRLAEKIHKRCVSIEIWNRAIKVGVVEPRNKI